MAYNGALSEEELKQFNHLLQRAQQHGVQMPAAAPFEEVSQKSAGKFGSPTVKDLLETPSSSMTDACKRPRGSPEWEHVDYTPVVMPETSRPENFMVPSKQLPVVPSKEGTESIALPPGLSSLEEWGAVVNKMPKFAHMKWSYKEMADSKDPDVIDYLEWVMQHGRNKGGRFQDFCDYLRAIKYTPAVAADGVYFPGSKEVRTFKK